MVMPLDHVRVLEWTAWQQGPIAGSLLADMGAEVIKIEEPRGEPARGLASMYGVPILANAYIHNCNRGKKGIVLNLRSEEGVELLHALAAKSDVFITNRVGGDARQFGYDWETLRSKNPRLIYAYASGYGPKGPDANLRSADLCGQARGGLMSVSRPVDLSYQYDGAAMADEMGGFITAYGVLLALIARERTGRGQRVDTSLLSGQIELGRLAFQQQLFGTPPPPSPSRELRSPLINMYPCGDGKWIAFTVINADVFWGRFCEMLGIPEFAADPRFETSTSRGQHVEELMPRVKEAFLAKSRDEWLALARAVGMEQVAPVQDYEELSRDPQVLANDYVVEVDDPTLGRVKVPGLPAKLSDTPGKVRCLAPELGQHTEEVLLDVLGYTWDEIVRLRDKGII